MKIYDVVIVGGGPAGSSLAILLAAAGFSVLLLERGVFPRDKVCGDFVSPKGLRYLERLGCYQEVARRGFTPIRGSHVYLDGAELSRGELPHLPGHPPFGHAIPRVELDEIVFRRAQEVGATTVEDCRVGDFQATPELVCVEATVGRKPRRFAGRLIVGADGANSTVARIADLEMNDPRHVLASIRTYAEGPDFRNTILFFDEDFFPGFGWIFPVRPGRSNIGVGMVKEPLARGRLRLKDFFGRLERFVRAEAREAGTEVTIGPTAGWPIKTYGGACRNYFDRGLLVGEAGCFVDPISGEGIPLAFESAELAAATVAAVFERGRFDAASLAEYESRWRARWEPDLAVSDLVVSMIRNRHLAKLWLQSFRVMGMTARRDRAYALKTGGILAGLVPNREAFSPDVIVKSVVHGPQFWLEFLGATPSNPLPDLLGAMQRLLLWGSTTAGEVLSDLGWVDGWGREVARKQRHVAEVLIGGAGPELRRSRGPGSEAHAT